MDVHDEKTRSYNMSRIKSKDTYLEIIVRRSLFKKGFRFRLHDNCLPGKPDIVFKKLKTVIFVHGCYFHGHNNCKLSKTPSTRKDFWKAKIKGNVERDSINELLLNSLGWRIIKVWECEIEPRKKHSLMREKTLEELEMKLLAQS